MTDDCSGTLLTRYLDGELDGKGRAAVNDHIAACPSCACELKLMAGADAALTRLPAVDPSPFFSARVMAAARSMNRSGVSLRRFLRVPVPAMAVMIIFILVNLFTFAFNINAMENGMRRELARKVVAQFAKPASMINPLALARLCGECNKYMCLCMHEAGKKSICPCKDCEMEKASRQAEAEKAPAMKNMEKNNVH